MKIINDINELNVITQHFKQNDEQIAFVPTMGALHAGHFALVEPALKYTDNVIVSIFVNPTQFAADEDLDTYPSTLEADTEKLKAMGIKVLWLPSVKDIYPNGQKTDVHVAGISEVLEGAYRPHFFDGVATVVKRLFDFVQPDFAFFGEKDFQQLQVVRQMVKDFDMPIKIIGVPTVRDNNGLALSSRNVYLTEEQYYMAIQLNKVLKQMARREMNEQQAHEKLKAIGFHKIDYCTAVNSETFEPENPNRVLAAVYLGKTRLIDNIGIIDK